MSFSVSLSGLFVAARRLEVSASNVANVHSTSTRVGGEVLNEPYRAQRVDAVSNSLGGAYPVVRDANPPTRTEYNPTIGGADPATGLAEVPNVNLEQEAINQLVASYDFKANLRVIEAESEQFKNLLDITS